MVERLWFNLPSTAPMPSECKSEMAFLVVFRCKGCFLVDYLVFFSVVVLLVSLDSA